ncbi:hypothetical protein EJB05_51165, partial [Eragrostis curvula]
METALGSAHWVLGKVLNKLSDDLVAAYVSSKELGLNYEKIEAQLLETQAVLHVAQQRGVGDNSGLQGLLQKLSKKADEADNALDELHYFMIQDKLDGTREAIPDLGDGLSNDVQHVRHAAGHTAGNWLSYFSCCRAQDDPDVSAVNNNTHVAMVKSETGSNGDAEKLTFDRVAMSKNIKSLIEEMHTLCDPIIKLLQISPSSNPQQTIGTTLKRPITCATVTENKLYGRDAIFNKTIDELTGGVYHETLSVLPIVGPGGIGKTTFTQHLYNHEKTKEHFQVMVWVCVSTNFDVLKLTQEILSCLPAAENEDRNQANTTNNLSLLHESIAKRLKHKSFLIVFDDIWECKTKSDWDTLLAPFKKRETKGNMVLVTTRFPKIATMVKNEATNIINLQGLEPDEFWKFFQDCVFGDVKDEKHEDDLIKIARAIADKLKCSPLAAKTVGPLLRKNHHRDHWNGILENKEWQSQGDNDNIMPALKISYDYLPFRPKKCFTYCALFPEDHKFRNSELIAFWEATGIIPAGSGETYLKELVDNGFLIKKNDCFSQYYMLHDLLHELSQSVSSQECLNISFPNFKHDKVPKSVRHVSVTTHGECFKIFEEEMDKLKTRIDIGNLRSLMVFGRYQRKKLANVLKDTFNDINNLRVLFFCINSTECLPLNFSKLIHLRYLQIGTPRHIRDSSIPSLPSAISRFYHLNFLDLENWHGSHDVPKGFNHLVNLRHIYSYESFHSNIPGVGKLECLAELKRFHAKKESVGFELTELEKLTKLRGSLNICGLEKVRTKEEAEEAKLQNKCNIRELSLEYGRTRTTGHDAIEGLQPHPSLKGLDILNHPGAAGPSWLCRNICVTSLERLYLCGISWKILPSFGRLPFLKLLKLCDIRGLCKLKLTDGSFKHLKEFEISTMPDLVECVRGDNSQLLLSLESIKCDDCPNLTMLPFYDCSYPSTEGTDITWFPKLRELDIEYCPKLSQLPPMPYTSTLENVKIEYSISRLIYSGTYLTVDYYCYPLVFQNLGRVEIMSISDEVLVSLTDLQKLNSLRVLHITGDVFSGDLDDDVVLSYVQELRINEFHPSERWFSNIFKKLPALSELEMESDLEFCEGHEGAVVLQFPSSSLLRKIKITRCCNFVLNAKDGGAFRNLTSLHSLIIEDCCMLFAQLHEAEESEIINLIPASVRELCITAEQSECIVHRPRHRVILPMALLSNLTSLTILRLSNCYLMMQGFNPLIVPNLKRLEIVRCSSVAAEGIVNEEEIVECSSVGSEELRNCGSPAAEEIVGCSSVAARVLSEAAVSAGYWQLEHLLVDSIAAALVAPVCSRLSATLRTLECTYDDKIERFTEEQGRALELLTNLEELTFVECNSLQSLPEALHRLGSLERLDIRGCLKIQSLPDRVPLPPPASFHLQPLSPVRLRVSNSSSSAGVTAVDATVGVRAVSWNPNERVAFRYDVDLGWARRPWPGSTTATVAFAAAARVRDRYRRRQLAFIQGHMVPVRLQCSGGVRHSAARWLRRRWRAGAHEQVPGVHLQSKMVSPFIHSFIHSL